MKRFTTLCALACLVCGFALNSIPAFSKDAAADEAKNEAKAASETNKANAEASKGHSVRAGRAAKKAEKANEKVAKDHAKTGQ
jgi:hypothetical protein